MSYCKKMEHSDFEPECEESSLDLIDTYSVREGSADILMYKCTKCNRLWKCVSFEGERRFLKMGEISIKREEYVRFATKYPIIYFENEEAYYYDNSLFCGNPIETKKYKNLTCSPKTLNLVKRICFEDAGATYLKEEIYKCRKCGTLWKLKEGYDSHHGFSFSAEIYSEKIV